MMVEAFQYHFLEHVATEARERVVVACGIRVAPGAPMDEVVLSDLVDLVHHESSLEAWIRDPRYLRWREPSSGFSLYGPDRVDPKNFPALEAHQVLAIELAHAMRHYCSSRLLRRVVRLGCEIRSCRPEAGSDYVAAVEQCIAGSESQAIEMFHRFSCHGVIHAEHMRCAGQGRTGDRAK